MSDSKPAAWAPSLRAGSEDRLAAAAITGMRPPSAMQVICIDVTNRCDLRCSNCTRLLAQQPERWDMPPAHFRAALRSLAGYAGVIAMIGGNPCLHPDFAALCRIVVEEVPLARQRGLWSNNIFDHQALVRDSFGFFNLNPHDDARGLASLAGLRAQLPEARSYQGPSRHGPVLAAARDLQPDAAALWADIGRCDVNQQWSASIVENRGRLRAYFCEVAAAFDLARGTDHGLAVEAGWWRRPIDDFAAQIRHFCPGCGLSMRLPPRLDRDETDDYTPSNADLLERGRRRAAVRVAPGTAQESRPVTAYADGGGVERLVSVVIPCFNQAATLAEAVASARAQALAGHIAVEVIVVDDASDDATAAVAEALCARHPHQLRLLRRAVNGGAAAARNSGWRQAAGDWICFLDADDAYAPGFFEAALRVFAEQPGCAMVLCGVELLECPTPVHPAQLEETVFSLPSNMLLRRDAVALLGGFPEDAAFRGPSAGEDVAFKRAFLRHFQAMRLQEAFLRYRVRPGGCFERFLASTRVEAGRLVFTRTAEAPEALAAAQAAYTQAVDARVQGLQRALRPRPFDVWGGLSESADYDSLRTRLAALGGVAPLEGYAAYRCAAFGPGPGQLLVAASAPLGLKVWLEEGSRASGRGTAGPGELRLLALEALSPGGGWRRDLTAALPRLGAGALLLALGLTAAEEAELLSLLPGHSPHWPLCGRQGRIAVWQWSGA
ncbi:putative glycosyltransferase EpsJ [mine drainage metagenome]|uniref:Putative glycosyltransferase EpsJ n=1 Tax=mine drainage metagenome TaxID=410659 RepID=A0A1J5RP65_9ZZZZ